jgi:hypothetical protein
MAKSKHDIAAQLKAGMRSEEKGLEDRFSNADRLIFGQGAKSDAPPEVSPTADSPISVAPEVTVKGPLAKARKVASLKEPAVPVKAEAGLVLRDTFSMPEADYALIEFMRGTAAMKGKIHTRSEVVRAALRLLSELPADKLLLRLAGVARMKPGRKPGA